jgi:hypothetical protein
MSVAKKEILEKIHRLERQILDQMEEHRLFMERFFTTGDQHAKDSADQILHARHRLKNEILELKEQFNEPE